MLLCDAVCGLFRVEADQVDRWLDQACEQVLRVCEGGLETGGGTRAEGVAGVWACLVEEDHPPGAIHPHVGVWGYGDGVEQEHVRERIRLEIGGNPSRPLPAPRLSGKSADCPASGIDGLAERLGAVGLPVEGDEFHGSALYVGVISADGRPLPALRESVLFRAVCRAMGRAVWERVLRPRRRIARLTGGLSQVQRQVLELLIEGITEHEIASRLGRSRHTVHGHVRGIYKTLGMSSRAELISVWSAAGRR
ncbi:MAG: LuxR C-terminal-related transcriptional regulator [Phycisphaerales bacterium]